MSETEAKARGTVGEVARVFLRLGFTAFGGPAAHIAMFRQELVTQRKWVTDEEFLDLLGATNLIPGPNSTEMAIHLGYVRAGWRGLIVGGLCFLGPAMLIVMLLAALYVQYGSTPTAEWLLYGIKPVIVAVILQAVWGLARKAAKNWILLIVGVAAFALYLLGINELLLLFGCGLAGALILNARRIFAERVDGIIALLGIPLPALLSGALTTATTPYSLSTLFLTFLKIGSVLYGSGYVLLAFMRGDFVERLGWLTTQQLLDAVAVGQFTPGPLFTTATFVGYLLGGVIGAVAATVGIFLPSFIFVAISSPLIPKMRKSAFLGTLLDAVNMAALGLMAAVTVELGRSALIDPLTIGLALASALLLIRYKLNATWLILGGALIGLVYALFTGAL